MTAPQPMAWAAARAAAYAAGRAAVPEPLEVPLARADGLTLASPLTALTDLPAFPTSTVDGYAVRGEGPWRIAGRVLAGSVPPALDDGAAMEIATGAMVPAGTELVIAVEDAEVADASVRARRESAHAWRVPGDEATRGEQLAPAGVTIAPGLIGLAAACGYDTLRVIPAPRVGVVIFGDELLVSGPPGQGRVRDSLGPQLPGWLRRFGAELVLVRGPVEDTLSSHLIALTEALARCDVVCTTGGTMRGPVDHLHSALATLEAHYLVNTVAVRPGFPMLLAQVPTSSGRTGFVAGLPGNPQSAIVALVSLVVPLLHGLAGRSEPPLRQVTLASDMPGRGDFTYLGLVRTDESGLAHPLPHAGSAMLRGLAQADGFAVIAPGTHGAAGDNVPLLPLPMLPGEQP